MQQPTPLRRVLTLGLGASLVLGALPIVAQAAAGKEPSQVGAANFDRVQERLVIPVQGPTPRIVVKRLAPRQYVADLSGSVLMGGEAQGQRLRSPALAGWSLDQEPASKTVRLRMTLTTDVQPRVRFDRRSGGYVVSFATPAPVAAAPKQGAPARKPATVKTETKVAVAKTETKKAAPKPAPAKKPAVVAHKPTMTRTEVVNRLAERRLPQVAAKPKPRVVTTARVAAPKPAEHKTFISQAPLAQVGVPTYDAARGMLVIPVAGDLKARDLDVVKLTKRWSYLDIPGSRPTFTGVKYQERADKLFQRWVMAKRPGRNTTRLSFALGAPANIDVELAGRELLIAVRPDAPMLGAAPAAKPAVAAKPEAVAAKPEAGKPEIAAPAVKAPPAAPAAKPAPLAAAPVKPAAKPSVRLATKPAPIAVARRNPVPGGVIETRLRRPFYDAERFGLVIPYEGRTPLYRWRKKTEGGVELELKGDVVSQAHLQPEVRRHGSLGTWKFDRRTAGTLAVDVAFARPSELVVAADPERKQLLLIPQPRLHEERAAENASPQAALATVALDRDGTNLFIPYNGNVPRYTIEQVNPTFAYINFERAALRDAGVQFYAPDYHPTVNYWMVTEPENTTTVRLAVALARPGAAAVYQDPSAGRLVVVVGDHAPVVQATGPRLPRVPEPWPGAANPGTPAGEPVSLK